MERRMTRRTLLGAAAATGAALALGPRLRWFEPALATGPAEPAGVRFVPSACEMCTARCPIIVRVRDGVVEKIEGNPKEGATGGAICARGNAAVSLLYDPDRLKYPLIRTGERGSGEFRRATWDEAYAYIGERLTKIKAEHGPEALAVARRPNPNDPFLLTFAQAFGTPNVFTHESTCPQSRNVALETTFGTLMFHDYANCDYLVLFGRNHFETLTVPQAQGVIKAQARGARVIYLDPRFTPTAAQATKHYAIRPGTDLAFALAMIHVIVREKLYDPAFVATYAAGFDELEPFIAPYTPAWAAEQTGIPAAEIVQVARDLALNKPRSAVEYGWFTASFASDFQLRRAIAILNTLLGNLEVPGGTFFTKGLAKYAKPLGSWKRPTPPKPGKPRADGAGVPGRYPLAPVKDGIIHHLPEIIMTGQPYPVKAFLAYRFDPVASVPDQQRTIAAFKQLDLLVTMDVYLTDTALYSDVVLPECSFLERTDPAFEVSSLVPKIRLRQQIVPPMHDTRPAWRVFKELAGAAGIGDSFGYRDIDEVLTAQLAPLGLTPDDLKKAGQWAPPDAKPIYLRQQNRQAPLPLATKSKKIDVYSEHLHEFGFPPLPVYTAPPQPLENRLYFVQGKSAVHTNIATQNVPWLHELRATNEVWLHPTAAAARGIKDGDLVAVRSDRAEQRARAKVTEFIRPETVFVYHGWGRLSPGLSRVTGKGVSGNRLLPARTDPISGSALLRDTFVEVLKV